MPGEVAGELPAPQGVRASAQGHGVGLCRSKRPGWAVDKRVVLPRGTALERGIKVEPCGHFVLVHGLGKGDADRGPDRDGRRAVGRRPTGDDGGGTHALPDHHCPDQEEQDESSNPNIKADHGPGRARLDGLSIGWRVHGKGF